MSYLLVGLVIWLAFAVSIRIYFKKRGEPEFCKTYAFRSLIAGLLLVLNFLDWWLTKYIIQFSLEYESNPFIRFLVEQSPFAGEFHKLATGSIVVVILSFAFHSDALLAFVFLLASILIMNGVTLILLVL